MLIKSLSHCQGNRIKKYSPSLGEIQHKYLKFLVCELPKNIEYILHFKLIIEPKGNSNFSCFVHDLALKTTFDLEVKSESDKKFVYSQRLITEE